jgi:S-DNA-T family DNA segregation ATPase FtsK/SpoIIIE
MAKSSTTSSAKSETDKETKKSWKFTKQHKFLFGCFLVLFSVALFLSMISFFIYWKEDQSAITSLTNRSVEVHNWLGKIGAYIADFFLYKGFGIASFLLVRLFFLSGIYMILSLPLKKLKNVWFWDLFAMVNFSLLFGFFSNYIPELGGVIGFEMNSLIQDFMGKPGTLLVLVFSFLIYLIFKVNVSPETFQKLFERKKKEIKEDLADAKSAFDQPLPTNTKEEENLAARLVADFGEFDPTLELSNINFQP